MPRPGKTLSRCGRWLVWIGAMCLALIGAGEVGLRLAGGLEFPLYVRDPLIGYYPKPGQQGVFLHRNDWAINERGMATPMPFAVHPDTILLVGDSIVYGGNPVRLADRLASALARETGRPVYPLAAGGWALENELRMLRANPDLLKVPTIVWVSESGDFGEAARWSDTLNWPVHQPVSALGFYIGKYLLQPHDTIEAPRSSAADALWQADLRWFLRNYHGRIYWVLYPERREVGSKAPVAFTALRHMIADRATVIDVFAASDWNTGLYRDAVIHPSAAGNARLARIIARGLE